MSCEVMGTFHWFPLLLLTSLVLWHGSYCGEQLRTNGTTKDGTYLKYAILGITSCSEKCIRVVPCESYDYNTDSLTCVLYTSDVGMYKKKVGGICSKMACSKTSVCLRNQYGQPICIRDVYLCGGVPTVQHGQKTSNKGYYRGAVTTYNCEPTYTPCVMQITSSCESNGQWKPVPHLCGKFILHKPKLGSKQEIPCGRTSKFAVWIFATPLKDSRFYISVIGGEDQIMIVTFVLNSDGLKNKLGFNSYMNGHYAKSDSYVRNAKLTVGKEVRAYIAYSKEEFTVQVNGGRKNKYPDKSSNPPEFVEVSASARVRLIKFRKL